MGKGSPEVMTTPFEKPPIPYIWLRHFRFDAGMTLDDLSGASGVGKVTISQIEHGRTPSPATKRKLSGALNLPVELVFPPPGAASPKDVLNRWIMKETRT